MPPTRALRPLLMSSRKLLLDRFSAAPTARLAYSSTRSYPTTTASAPRRCAAEPVHLAICRRLYSTPSSGTGSASTTSSEPSSAKPAESISESAKKNERSPPPSSSSTPQSSPDSSSTEPPPEPNKSPEASLSEPPLSALSTRFAHSMDNLQSRLLIASQRLNDLTGYTEIERIKANNTLLEARLSTAQSRLAAARTAYKKANASRATTARETTSLLARRDTWSPLDLERFTSLYKADHELESEVAGAAAELTEAEGEEQRLSREVTTGMLRRYHEEQIWSDRIRRQSTWGTWGLMGVNVVLFLVLQFVAEPWRRGRLVSGVVEREAEVLGRVERELGEVKVALAGVGGGVKAVEDGESELAAGGAERAVDAPPTVPVTDTPRTATEATWGEVLSDPARWKTALVDLYSERRIDLTMRDASLLALEGAIAGGAVVAGIAAFWLRRA